jgi:hypothetical protein
MDDRLCVVQFLHPGAEHIPPANGQMAWNTGAHRRKFLSASGSATDGRDVFDTELVFWGEWEPDSRVVETYPEPVLDGPRWLHEPGWRPLEVGRWAQNTDPFVFGDQFHYTGCQQHKRRNGLVQPTQLRALARGSVILFGACRRDQFVLDTVLVVDGHLDHGASDHTAVLANRVSETYRSVVLEPWYRGNVPEYASHRLYFGATPARPVNGMFSFAPCRLRADTPRGFARPVIELPGVITDHHKQSYKLNPQATIAACAELWEAVAEQVLRSGSLLATHFDLPQRWTTDQARSSSGAGAARSCR